VVKQVQKTVETEEAERVLLVKVSKQNSKKSSRGGRKFGAIEHNYWKEHKMVSQNRTIYGEVNGERVKVGRKAQQKCYFFGSLARACALNFWHLGVEKMMAGAVSRSCKKKKNIL
jgi:hypothetical protein